MHRKFKNEVECRKVSTGKSARFLPIERLEWGRGMYYTPSPGGTFWNKAKLTLAYSQKLDAIL